MDSSQHRHPRSSSPPLALRHTLVVLHTLDSGYSNTPPRLLTPEATAQHDRPLQERLLYEDDEGDEVAFSLRTADGQRGRWPLRGFFY
jgi:hypothetical protein